LVEGCLSSRRNDLHPVTPRQHRKDNLLIGYQSLNPAAGKLLKKFDELTDKQLEDKLAAAEKCFKTSGR